MTKLTENIEDLNKHCTNSTLYPRLLTLKQAAKYLGRGVDSLRDLVYGGVFPCIQEGSRSKIWLDIQDLNSWIQRKKRYMGRPSSER